MRVLMLGWEYPPFMSGGLGTACYFISTSLAKKGVDVVFVQPQPLSVLSNGSVLPSGVIGQAKARLTDHDAGHEVQLVSASGVAVSGTPAEVIASVAHQVWEDRLSFRIVDSALGPYLTEQGYGERLMSLFRTVEKRAFVEGAPPGDRFDIKGGYGPDLMAEVYRYSLAVAALAARETFDLIHVHDWMTYPAGIMMKKLTGKPLVAHAHALECDRSGDNVNPTVAHMEWEGFDAADKIVAVSHYTKQRIIERYAIAPKKIEVVHNAVTRNEAVRSYHVPELQSDEKRVLFMGRVTMQKGPEYFVEAARLVMSRLKNVRFIMSGSGDMLARMVQRVAELRMGSRFHFTGFLKGDEVEHMYAISDLYVMPSVSEPFGISTLEAMLYDVPVILSRQSGVSEVVHNTLLVDFWDVGDMAEQICAVLTNTALAAEMVKNSREELKHLRWDSAADHLLEVYNKVL